MTALEGLRARSVVLDFGGNAKAHDRTDATLFASRAELLLPRLNQKLYSHYLGNKFRKDRVILIAPKTRLCQMRHGGSDPFYVQFLARAFFGRDMAIDNPPRTVIVGLDSLPYAYRPVDKRGSCYPEHLVATFRQAIIETVMLDSDAIS